METIGAMGPLNSVEQLWVALKDIKGGFDGFGDLCRDLKCEQTEEYKIYALIHEFKFCKIRDVL